MANRLISRTVVPMVTQMNTITNLEFYFFSPQRLMNGGGTCNAGRPAKVLTRAIPCLSGFWKLLPTINAAFKERFRDALIVYEEVPESAGSKKYKKRLEAG